MTQHVNQSGSPPSESEQKKASVRIVGRADGVVVHVKAGQDWMQLLDMLEAHLAQANGFFRGEQIVLELGDTVVDDLDLRYLINLLYEQEVSLRTLRTTQVDVQKRAEKLSIPVTLQMPHPQAERQNGQRPNWEVFLEEKQDRKGESTEAAGEESMRSGTGVGVVESAMPRPKSNLAETYRAETGRADAPRSSEALYQRIAAPPYFYRGTLRSGQVFRHAGPVIMVGDVNPGAELISGGDVYIWGRLRGMVHAGAMGNESSVVGALDFEPVQLRIAGHIAMSPKSASDDPARWFWRKETGQRPEIARVDKNRIVVDQWDADTHIDL